MPESGTLLLLHGLAGTARVWDPVIERLAGAWDGPILAPDFPGHGGRAPAARYSFGGLAAAVAEDLDPGATVEMAVGHSLGGVAALALGSGWFGVTVRRVLALSIKVAWTDEELAGAAAIAAKPTPWFDTRDEAVARYLRVSGLAGLVDPSSPIARAGVVEDGGRLRLAHDLRVSAVGAPDMVGLLAACRADVVLGCGSEDPMVGHDQLVALDPSAIRLDGLGHTPHVEDPGRVAELVLSCAGRPRRHE